MKIINFLSIVFITLVSAMCVSCGDKEPDNKSIPQELDGNWQYILKDNEGYTCYMIGLNKELGTYQLRAQIDNEINTVGGTVSASKENIELTPTFGDTSLKVRIIAYAGEMLKASINGENYAFIKVDSDIMPYYRSNKGKMWVGT